VVVLTSRPEFSPPWNGHMHVTFLTLNRLGRSAVNEMLLEIPDERVLPNDLRDHIVSKTDGTSLFIEELTESVLESDLVVRTQMAYQLKGPLSTLGISSTLQDSLLARLHRIPEMKGVAQTAAAIGREFSLALLGR